MCTIVVLHRVHAAAPTLVGANRDEFMAREALGPRALREEPRVVGGLDVLGGGTWLGAHADGLFVGLTNQRTFAPPDRGLRSRGEVTLEALARGSFDGVRALVGDLDPRAYNSFNLIWGDGERLGVAHARQPQGTLDSQELGPGIHVLSNDRLGSATLPKTQRARDAASRLLQVPAEALPAAFRALLSDHTLPPLEQVQAPPPGSAFDRALVRRLDALCIHTPLYGTRSSTLVALEPGRVLRYLFAAGPPCEADFQDVTPLLRSGDPG